MLWITVHNFHYVRPMGLRTLDGKFVHIKNFRMRRSHWSHMKPHCREKQNFMTYFLDRICIHCHVLLRNCSQLSATKWKKVRTTVAEYRWMPGIKFLYAKGSPVVPGLRGDQRSGEGSGTWFFHIFNKHHDWRLIFVTIVYYSIFRTVGMYWQVFSSDVHHRRQN